VDRQGARRPGRNIEYSSNADVAYDTALDCAVTGNFGYFRITTDYAADDVFDQDIKHRAHRQPAVGRAAIRTAWTPIPRTGTTPSSPKPTRSTPSRRSGRTPTPAASRATARTSRRLDRRRDIRVAEWWTRREVAATLLQLSNGMVMLKEQYEKAKELLDVQGGDDPGHPPDAHHEGHAAHHEWLRDHRNQRVGRQVHPDRAGLRRRGDHRRQALPEVADPRRQGRAAHE
jgi:hypothetical protein